MSHIIQSKDFTNKINTWVLFGTIVLVHLIILFVSNHYVFNEEVYVRSFSDQLTLQSIEAFWDLHEQYRWLGYIFKPLMVLLKVSFAAVCISIGIILLNFSFKFKTIFRATLVAEGVFIIAKMLYMANLSFHLNTFTLETAANYFPLTILSYFGTENVVQWLHYPLQTLNIFEVFYMLAIAWLLTKQWNQDFMESLAIVIPSYGTGLLLWLGFVTFVSMQVS